MECEVLKVLQVAMSEPGKQQGKVILQDRQGPQHWPTRLKKTVQSEIIKTTLKEGGF